jgi:hypothetical protein
MRGALAHTGTAYIFGWRGCVYTFTDESVVDHVEGLVMLNGRSPAPASVDLWWVVAGGKDPLIVTRTRTSECTYADSSPSTYGSKSLVWRYPSKFSTKPIDWAAKFGKPFTIEQRENLDGTDPGNHLCEGARAQPCRVSYRWTLSFVPVEAVEKEQWRVEVAARTGRGGDGPLGGGVWVDW